MNIKMNIKRRLFVSHILMLVIPLVMSVAVFWCGMIIVENMTGLKDRRDPEAPRRHAAALAKARSLAQTWERGMSDTEIAEGTSRFNEEHAASGIFLSVYRNGVSVTPQPLEEMNPMLAAALRSGAPATFVSRMHVDVERVGALDVAVMGVDFHSLGETDYRSIMATGLVLSLLCSLLVAFLTNRFLTQFVFGRIVSALDTLADGVRRIRDGDLKARIDYPGDDEFAPICRDFNEMAARLLDSVSERERNEASRRELIAGMSHDLRTPLTSIKAYVEGLQQGVASTDEARKRYVGTIGNKTAEMERILDKLFLFSKLDIGGFPYHMERMDLVGALSEVVGELGDEYRAKGLDVSFEANPEAIFVYADAMQFRNIVVNVLENSVRYKTRERAAMQIVLVREGNRAVISFTDDGPGVPEEALSKLFDVFYRADPSRSNSSAGSGLGLAIASKIVERFGGDIAAENVPRGGLSIVVRLPVCAPEEVSA